MEPRRLIDRWLEATLRIHPGEQRSTLLLFLQCLSVVGALVVARAARDALLLSRLSPSALPRVYLLAAAAVGLAGAAWARVGPYRPLDRIMPATALASALALVAARLVRGLTGPWLDLALYAGVEVIGALTLAQLWSHAAAMHDPRSARRLFPLIAAGGTLAGALAGLAVGSLSRRWGVENLLWLAALLLAAAAAASAVSAREAGSPLQRATARPPTSRRPADRHLILLGVLSAITLIASTLVDYQFKSAAAARHAGNPSALGGFLGMVSAGSGLVALVVQVGLTSRLLGWLGLAGTLALLPAALVAGSGAALLAGGMWPAILARGADQTLRYTTTDSASRLVLLPLPPPRRTLAKTLADGLVRPAALAAGGLILLALPRSWRGPSALALATLVLCLAWLAMLPGVHRLHLAALRDALRKGRAGASPEDGRREWVEVLRAALASADPAELAWALSRAREAPGELQADVLPHLAHPDPRLRTLACLALAGQDAAAEHLLPLLADPAPAVRAAALAAHPGPPVERLRQAAEDGDPEVRGAALRALLRAGDRGLAAPGLAALADSADPALRRQAARLLGPAADAGLEPLPGILLHDADPSVRSAALASAGAARTDALLPALAAALGHAGSWRAAADALAARGAGTEAVLAPLLADARERPVLRRRAALVLGRLATPEAAALLARRVGDEDEAVRGAVAEALGRAIQLHPGLPLERDLVLRVIRVELVLAWRAVAAAEALGLPEASGRARDARDGARHLLAAALTERVDRAVDRALRLVRLLQPAAELDLAREALADQRRRAAGVELLDTLLDRRLRRLLLPLVEQGSRRARLREVAGLAPLDSPDWLRELLRDEGAWMAAAAAWAAGELRRVDAAPRVAELLTHPVDWVREAALTALERLLPPAELARAARDLTADPFAPARERALAICERGGAVRPEVPG
ncbi:MAG: HEAT repeat domain-containing protein [Deltaproteobacteria bacterium]|nr:HEAT repeat domain-containing protein [Deltaproteobacteria bacterium]